MKTSSITTALALSVALYACGGEPKPAQVPEAPIGVTETSATEDMPAPPQKEIEEGAPAAEKADRPTAAGGMLTVVEMKVLPTKKGSMKPVELKADGTVMIDGKPAAMIKGDQVDSAGGTSMLTIGVDGSLVGNGVQPGLKFDGDELVTDAGVRVAVSDDGTITATKDDKSEAIAKIEGPTTAKRAALVLTALWLEVPKTVKGDAKAGAKH